jgi:hypothetical protein
LALEEQRVPLILAVRCKAITVLAVGVEIFTPLAAAAVALKLQLPWLEQQQALVRMVVLVAVEVTRVQGVHSLAIRVTLGVQAAQQVAVIPLAVVVEPEP